jgi:hypothetical protein
VLSSPSSRQVWVHERSQEKFKEGLQEGAAGKIIIIALSLLSLPPSLLSLLFFLSFARSLIASVNKMSCLWKQCECGNVGICGAGNWRLEDYTGQSVLRRHPSSSSSRWISCTKAAPGMEQLSVELKATCHLVTNMAVRFHQPRLTVMSSKDHLDTTHHIPSHYHSPPPRHSTHESSNRRPCRYYYSLD